MATRALKHVPKESSDLGLLAQRETSVVTLLSPIDQTDTGYRVEIKSYYSDEADRAVDAWRAAHPMEEGAEDTTFTDSLPEQVIAVTVRWWKEGESTDTITLNGDVLSATPENVRRVYGDPQFAWIQRAVRKDYLRFANFFGAAKAS